LNAAPLIAALFACGGATAQEGAEPWAIAVFPSGAEFRLEIAADARSQQLGYMFREHVGPRDGMLFLFEETARHSFWMKNCKVSLDIIFLDENLEVVEIAHDRPPCPEEGECPSAAPLRASRFVLEVAGGVAAAEGLRPGQRLVVLSEPPLF
jgi:uncharacterized membrane protein (UPF0127 family)